MVSVLWPSLTHLGQGDGLVTEARAEHYAQRARAGTGMIIVEATAVSEDGRCWQDGLNAYADRHLPGLSLLAQRIHNEGAVAAIQLLHAGPRASPEIVPTRLGPSTVEPSGNDPGVQALTVEQIQRIEQQFEEAAGQAVEAGFDAVEVHGAHGFLLDAFLSCTHNRRTDAYGGSLAGRMLMLVETCKRVKGRIGDEALLLCRYSLANINKVEEGFTPEDLQQLVRGLEEAGVDLLDVSTDGAFKGSFGTCQTSGQWTKQMSELPVIVAGGLGDPADANRAVAAGHADFAAVGRVMLEDAEWTRRARETLA